MGKTVKIQLVKLIRDEKKQERTGRMKRNREVYMIVDALLRNNVIQEKDAEKAGVAVKAAMKTIRSDRYARKVIER